MILLIALLAAAPEVLWSGVTSGGVYSSVAPGDMDGDGVTEVVCGLNFWDDQPTLWCLSGADGDTLWTSSSCKGIYQDEGMLALPDMNGSGRGDVLLATPGGYAPPARSVLLVEGSDGAVIWQWSAYQSVPGGTGWGYCCAEVPLDMTGDSLPELLAGFGTTGSSGTGLAACLDGASGDTLWTLRADDAVEDVMAVPDVTGDGFMEAVLGIGGNSYTESTLVLVDGASGGVLWEREGGGDVMCVTTVDRSDTVPWVACCTFDGEVRCYGLGGDSLWALSPGGYLLDIETGPDLDGDGISELALAADDSGTMCLSGADGSILWSFPSGSTTWSVAWVCSLPWRDSVIPAVASGSVNGRRVTLTSALDGQLLWEHGFDERVYNVTTLEQGLGPDAPVVMAGLQDQTGEPHHAWALLCSTCTGVEASPEGGAGSMSVTSPAVGNAIVALPEGTWRLRAYDLSGRLVLDAGTSTGDVRLDVSGWPAGCYVLHAAGTGGELGCGLVVVD